MILQIIKMSLLSYLQKKIALFLFQNLSQAQLVHVSFKVNFSVVIWCFLQDTTTQRFYLHVDVDGLINSRNFRKFFVLLLLKSCVSVEASNGSWILMSRTRDQSWCFYIRKSHGCMYLITKTSHHWNTTKQHSGEKIFSDVMRLFSHRETNLLAWFEEVPLKLA